ncbi:transcriptional regulator, AlpA family [Microbacterium hydrothermale]|uniref:helix-turn-helix transcriptional regulator n=1 Tax=Microbacterium hydrothermale TaxID=857427 RepID=UPI0022273564|nr:helix-turn-helix domain-containing protein [Microbacterium hydrothermale]MCW2165778.1 transcriptional regulator, AlpA family [Microbacterium hydrothermale]
MTISYSTDLPDLSTRKQVAEYLQVSVPTLDAWAAAGAGPKRLKIGRSVRYRREDVLSYVRELAEAN